MGWIDEEKTRRERGLNRPLLQSEHKAVNARYPGTTLEYCSVCNLPTGRAGKADDSLFCDTCEDGPFCEECIIFTEDGRYCEQCEPRDGAQQ